MPNIVVVADDLTGAADSAARCVQAGLTAEVWLEVSLQNASAEIAADLQADVVSVSTDSRFLPPEEAAQRVTATLAALSTLAGMTWYKRIDSTLRGNLGAELDAMLTALPNTVAIICPAFPAQGRGLEDGKLVYAGAPSIHLPTLLSEQSSSTIGEIGLATVRQGGTALERVLRERRAQGERLLVADGLTEDDLDIIVGAAQSGEYLLCGSAGMVAPLAARWVTRIASVAGGSSRVASGPILAVVGSGSEVAHAQVAQVAATEAMRVRALDKSWYEVDLVGAESHPVGDWLIHLAPPAEDLGLDGAVARAQAVRLADLTYAAVDRLQPTALMVVGGDTANFVLRRLGIERLTVVEELLPGIALTKGVDRTGSTLSVVLKPGNFGDAQTLVALQRAVQQRQV